MIKYLTLLFVFVALPAQAQSSLIQQRTVSDMNRIKPLQNPRYETIEDFRERRILDSANKVAGEIKDAQINPEGEIMSLLVNFDRLRLGQDVYLNYKTLDIGSVSTGYRLGFRSDDIEDIFPQLLAEIETAGAGDTINLNSIAGRKVTTTKGKILGRVGNVLFNDQATQVVGLYINVTAGTLRNEGIAIPFTAARFVDKASGPEAHINQALADYMIAYIKER